MCGRVQDSGICKTDMLDMLWFPTCFCRGAFCFSLLPDRYDAVTGAGLLIDSHVNEDCFPELIRIVKPGISQSRTITIINVELWLFFCCWAEYTVEKYSRVASDMKCHNTHVVSP